MCFSCRCRLCVVCCELATLECRDFYTDDDDMGTVVTSAFGVIVLAV